MCLVAACVILHALCSVMVVRKVSGSQAPPVVFWPAVRLLVQIVMLIVVVHAIEIGLWASYLAGSRLLPDLESAFYFSAVTYTTVGYGDLVLPKGQRLVAGLEALTGIIMCGWSTALLITVVMRSPLRNQPDHRPARRLEGEE